MFVVILTYTRPLSEVDALLPAHRAYLERMYAAGTFLLSGRMEPRRGGVILAHGVARAELEALLAEDPFHAQGVARYEVVEFVPGMAAPALRGLVAG